MADQWQFWLSVVAFAALAVAAVEIVHGAGSQIVLVLVSVSIVVLGASLIRRRADSGIPLQEQSHRQVSGGTNKPRCASTPTRAPLSGRGRGVEAN